jgi:CBS domain-containing protein
MLNVVENDKLVGVVTKANLLPLVKSNRRLREIMQKKIHIITPDDRVIHARRMMIDQNVARLPVVGQGKLVGIISDTEIAFALANIKQSFSIGKQKHHLDELLVKDVMKMPAVWAPPNMTASEAAKIMIKRNIGALPIIENDSIIGIVTRTDLLKTVPI